ncbi:MAG: AAA family ATPase, partial [Candidatus Eremiobacteraeota bacterium]|nr:AAA family ATPase [Candidatus Eremiobacteraeota bacterium]
SDLGELERLGDLCEYRDAQTVLIAVDGERPLYTTTEMKDVEARLARHAHVLARSPGVWNADAMERAIGKLVASDGFKVSGEQRAALGTLEIGRIAVIQGKPGTGKTTIMKAVRLYAEATGRDIVGLTPSQAAAERLSNEAGFKAVNFMRGQVMEKLGETVIPADGILVLDESGMTDSRMMETTLAIARSRNCTVVVIGDRNQLQPVAAGAAFTILQRESKAVGGYAELNEIRRQTRAWHRDAVGAFGDALEAKSAAGIRKAIQAMDAGHRFVGFDDEKAVIERAAEIWAQDAARGQRTLIVASDRDTVRYVNEAVRRMRGFVTEHAGMAFITNTGTKQLVAGDRFQFRKNKTFRGRSKSRSLNAQRRSDEHRSRGKGTVRNGDTGDVISVCPRWIEVRLDSGEIVAFDPTKYQSWSHGYASTIHASQGASVDKAVVLVGGGASAELMHVALSRAKKSMEVLFSRGNYGDAKEIGERVAQNIGTKITSQTIEEYVDRTGGLDSSRAIDAARRHAGDIDPTRNRYVAAMRERVRSSIYASDAIRERFGRVRERTMKDTKLSVAERAERCARLATEMRREFKRVRKKHAAEPFGKWLKTERAGEQRLVERREIRAKKAIDKRVERDVHDVQQELDKRTRTRSRSRGR